MAKVTYQHRQIAHWRNPIEIVEYAQATCTCCGCGTNMKASLPADLVEGQDSRASLQANLA